MNEQITNVMNETTNEVTTAAFDPVIEAYTPVVTPTKNLGASIATELVKDALIFLAGFAVAKVIEMRKKKKDIKSDTEIVDVDNDITFTTLEETTDE